MEPEDMCPPYWPFDIWHLLHPPKGPPPPPEQVRRVDELFTALATYFYAGHLHERAAGEIQALAGREATQALNTIFHDQPPGASGPYG